MTTVFVVISMKIPTVYRRLRKKALVINYFRVAYFVYFSGSVDRLLLDIVKYFDCFRYLSISPGRYPNKSFRELITIRLRVLTCVKKRGKGFH